MKRRITAFLLIATSVFAQPLGIAAASEAEADNANYLESWAFAGSAILTAALGIFVVSLHNGKSSESAQN